MGKPSNKTKEAVARTTKYDSDTEDIIMEVQGYFLSVEKTRVGIDKVVNDLIKEGYKAFKQKSVA